MEALDLDPAKINIPRQNIYLLFSGILLPVLHK